MMKILFQHRPSSFSHLFCIFYIFLSFTGGAFAETRMSIKQLKQQNIERALKYERLKNTKLPDPIRQSSPLVLPVDTDDDGMPDSYESANGLNPNNPDDAWFDPDKDEVVNLFEYQLGSDLNSSATPPIATVASSGADYTDVETAIDRVAPGTYIRVAEGTYRVNYVNHGTKVVMIQGGWKSDFSKRDLKLHSTTFDGGMSDEILYFSPYNEDAVIILDGINFIRGNGFFGAVNLLASGSGFTKTSIFNCSITESINTDGGFSSPPFGGVLYMTNWNTSKSDRTIANTIIVGNKGSGISGSITDETTARWRIINTTISNNLNGGDNGYGIDVSTLDTGELTAHIYNSIIRGNERDDLDLFSNITFEVDHSDIGNVDTIGDAIYLPGTGVVNVDPLFVDPTNGDFHLQSTSPVINKGINQGIPLIDFEGEPRVSGTTVDMGADEVAGGVNSLSMRWPLSGTLSDRSPTLRFGGDDTRDSRALCGGLPKKHTGLDVSAKKEEAVYAVEAGKVREIFNGGAEGYAVVIEHTDSIPVFTTVYWHVNPLDSLVVGEPVITKQKIATVADLGDNTHFHFGVRKSNHDGISKRGYLPQVRGDSDYDNLGDFTGCKTDPLFPEEFVDPDTISYVYGTNPVPDIKANGSDRPIALGATDNLSVSISLATISGLGVDCDWWVAASTPFGWYYFDASTMSWTYAGGSYTDLSPTYQGPLIDLSPFIILNTNTSGLLAGIYNLYFGVDSNMNGLLDIGADTNMDGLLDIGQLYSDSVSIRVNSPLNTTPTANITNPSTGSIYTSGDSIIFSGTGYDSEDGALSGNSLVWTSSIDGQIGTGESFTKSNLSVGTHNITLTVTDSGGLTISDSVNITVVESTTANWNGSWSCDGYYGTCDVSGGSLSLNLIDNMIFGRPNMSWHGTVAFSGSPCGLPSMDIDGSLMTDDTIRFVVMKGEFIGSISIFNYSNTSMSGRYNIYNQMTLCINSGTVSLNK